MHFDTFFINYTVDTDLHIIVQVKIRFGVFVKLLFKKM